MKYLDLDVGECAAVWIISFASQAALDEVTDDIQFKCLESLGVIAPCFYDGIRDESPVVWTRKNGFVLLQGEFLYCYYKVHFNSRINSYRYPIPAVGGLMVSMSDCEVICPGSVPSQFPRSKQSIKEQSLVLLGKKLYC